MPRLVEEQIEKEKAQETFIKKYNKQKAEYIKNNSLESMVYENGAATALLYKEMQKLVQEIHQLKNMLYGEDATNVDNKK